MDAVALYLSMEIDQSRTKFPCYINTRDVDAETFSSFHQQLWNKCHQQ